jgi:hypothetical protein
MTSCVGELKRTGNCNDNSNDKSAEQKVYVPPFAKCMRRMGHPSVLGGWGENRQRQQQLPGFFAALRMTSVRGRAQYDKRWVCARKWQAGLADGFVGGGAGVADQVGEAYSSIGVADEVELRELGDAGV